MANGGLGIGPGLRRGGKGKNQMRGGCDNADTASREPMRRNGRVWVPPPVAKQGFAVLHAALALAPQDKEQRCCILSLSPVAWLFRPEHVQAERWVRWRSPISLPTLVPPDAVSAFSWFSLPLRTGFCGRERWR